MKKVLALILACLTLTACGAETPAETEPTAATTPEQTIATTTTTPKTSAETTAAPVADSSEAEVVSLGYATIFQLSDVTKSIYIGDDFVFNGAIYRHGAFVMPDNQISYDADSYAFGTLRPSSRALRAEGEKSGFEAAVGAQQYFAIPKSGTAHERLSPYTIYSEDPLMTLNGYCETAEKIEVEDFKLAYSIYDDIKVNAFIKQDSYDKDRYDIIIDPAYMYGIPVISGKTEDMSFEVNGNKFLADTLKIYGHTADEKYPELFPAYGRYIYAALTLSSISVSYSIKNGYISEAYISDMKLITEDAEKALTESVGIGGGEKSPEMTAVYETLINNAERLNTPNTVGMTLLDLDFDNTPELLVAEQNMETETINGKTGAVEVSVYRIEGGELKYIDKLYNNLENVYSSGNVIGLKTLPDGTKKWFNMSYLDRATGKPATADYLFTLDGDKLNFTEVFRVEENENAESSLYYMGEKIEPSRTEAYDDYMRGDYTILEWNGIKAYFGMWELIGFIRQNYCKDMEESSYSLTSDWLIKPTNIYYGGYTKLEPTLRELEYNLAYAVDAFYLGYYDPAKKLYYYQFLGDYAKPVIYLYPEAETTLSVSLDFKNGGAVTTSYPKYNNGWNVTARPDGTLFDENGDEYYCLYWEGGDSTVYDDSKGFCVAASDTAEFLREKLLYIGLSAREANEFIIYWLPILEKNPYNRITFHTEDYAAAVPLTISEAPDSLIRVFMTYSPLETEIDIPAQELPHYERNGFTVVEWGGGER